MTPVVNWLLSQEGACSRDAPGVGGARLGTVRLDSAVIAPDVQGIVGPCGGKDCGRAGALWCFSAHVNLRRQGRQNRLSGPACAALQARVPPAIDGFVLPSWQPT